MFSLTTRHQLCVALLLVALMAVTRSHHFAGIAQLPDASWAAFFLAGVYLRRASVFTFVVLTVLATTIDWIAINLAGVSDFCVTPAYAMLLPAYAALWLGGRWYSRRHVTSLTTLPALTAAVIASAAVAELCSSGGFYFFGGRFTEPTLVEFLPRLVKYFPSMLGAMTLYVTLAALLHALLAAAAIRRSTRPS